MIHAIVLGVMLASPVTDGPAAAEEAFRKGDLQGADRICRAWLKDHPGDGGTTLFLGLVRFNVAQRLEGKQEQQARRMFLSSRKILEQAESMDARSTSFNIHHMIGYTYFLEKQYPTAIDRFTRALKQSPESADLYRLRGRCHLERRNIEPAAEDFSKAVELAPRGLNVRKQYARALFDLGRPEDARRTLRELYSLIEEDRPRGQTHWDCLYQIYVYSIRLNDLQGARAPLEAAKAIDSSHTTGRLELGLLYYRLGELDLAAKELDFVIASARTPRLQRVKAFHHRGLIAQHRRHWQEARGLFESALALSPRRANILRSYGAVLRRLGEDDRARRVLEQFRELAFAENQARRLRNHLLKTPQSRASRVSLIRILLDQDRKEEARTQLVQLERYHPRDPDLAELKRRAR